MQQSYSTRVRLFIVSLLCLTLFQAGFACSQSSGSEAKDRASYDAEVSIDVDDSDLNVEYGNAHQMEVGLKGEFQEPIAWEVTDYSALPPGLVLKESNTSTIVIEGVPSFLGPWCFYLTASTSDKKQGFKEICVNSNAVDKNSLPEFKTERYLPLAYIGLNYNQTILWNLPNESYTAEVSGESLPQGIQAVVAGNQVNISGTFTDIGSYIFFVHLTGANGKEVYKQFQLNVFNQDSIPTPEPTPEDPNPNPTPMCPDGYYWDPVLGYCVEDRSDRCPDGTFYDPETNSCVPYPAPPPEVYCGPGYYYDHYLNMCVRIGYPRCPIWTKWDPYYDRCVPDTFGCPHGYRWNYSLQQCVPVWGDRGCGRDGSWDPYRQRCVPEHRGCRGGDVYDRNGNKCRPSERGRSCGRDSHWDPRAGQCVPDRDHRNCPAGSHWDPQRRSCVDVREKRHCPPGTHWSPRANQCVRDDIDKDRHRRKPDRPRPKERPPKPRREPRREPRPEPRKEPRPEPRREPREEPRKEPRREPRPEPRKEPRPEPRREPREEPRKEPRREPRNEPRREPRSEPRNEPRGPKKPRFESEVSFYIPGSDFSHTVVI